MSGDGIIRVAVVLAELDPEALASSDLVTLHPSEKFSGLPRKHGPYNKLYVPLQLRESMMFRPVR